MNRAPVIAAAVIVAAIVLAAGPLFLPPFYVRVGQLMLYSAGLGLAWAILGGFAGYASFGHAAFIGVGAFTAGLVENHFSGLPTALLLPVGLLAAAAACAILSALIAYPILRLRGTFFAIAMLGVSHVCAEVTNNIDFFQGSMGLNFPPIAPPGMDPANFFYELYLAGTLLILLISWQIKRSRFGAGLLSIREDEDTARMLGVPTERYKRTAFVDLGRADRPDGRDLRPFAGLHHHRLGLSRRHQPQPDRLFAARRHRHAVRPGDRRLPAGVHHPGDPGPPARLPPVRDRAAAGAADPGGAGRRGRPVQAAADDMSLLEVGGLSKNFRGLAAISDVSFAIAEGSITSIIGPNGAGKSTMFNLITGYLAPTAGEIRFKDRRITGMATNRIAELGVARAFQIARPFRDLSVFENVRIGALFGKTGPRDVAATTRRALELAAIDQLAEQPASALTVGQLRHLEVARAIATRADLLLADEPCAGLNPTETAAMIDVLRQVRKNGVTVVLVEHDMPSVMEVSDRLLVLDAGRLIADGPPQAVANDPKVIAAYLGTPDAA